MLLIYIIVPQCNAQYEVEEKVRVKQLEEDLGKQKSICTKDSTKHLSTFIFCIRTEKNSGGTCVL